MKRAGIDLFTFSRKKSRRLELHKVCQNLDVEAVTDLLAQGVDPNEKQTPMASAFIAYMDSMQRFLGEREVLDNIKAIIDLLYKNGAKIDFDYYLLLLRERAIVTHLDLELIEFLLTLGANPNFMLPECFVGNFEKEIGIILNILIRDYSKRDLFKKYLGDEADLGLCCTSYAADCLHNIFEFRPNSNVDRDTNLWQSLERIVHHLYPDYDLCMLCNIQDFVQSQDGQTLARILENINFKQEIEVQLVKLLSRYNANFNLPDKRGNTALHLALHRSGIVEGFDLEKALLEAGSDPNRQDKEGVTPFEEYIWKFYPNVKGVYLFLRHGASSELLAKWQEEIEKVAEGRSSKYIGKYEYINPLEYRKIFNDNLQKLIQIADVAKNIGRLLCVSKSWFSDLLPVARELIVGYCCTTIPSSSFLPIYKGFENLGFKKMGEEKEQVYKSLENKLMQKEQKRCVSFK